MDDITELDVGLLENEQVQAEVPPIIVYTNSTIACPYCIRAKQALDENGYHYDERDIAIPEIKAELLQRRPTARTVPQIFLQSGYHIGGYDDLKRLIADLGTLIELNS